MINNGTLTYDHDRDGTLTQLAGCEAKFRNVDYDTHIAIKYRNEQLTVYTDLENKREWKVCFQSPNVKLPTGYYFGASATTGDLSDNHDIITFKFYELEPIADVINTHKKTMHLERDIESLSIACLSCLHFRTSHWK